MSAISRTPSGKIRSLALIMSQVYSQLSRQISPTSSHPVLCEAVQGAAAESNAPHVIALTALGPCVLHGRHSVASACSPAQPPPARLIAYTEALPCPLPKSPKYE
jgi:hypothetical protein